MTITGLLIGLIAFSVIGVFHPIVIYSEYHFGKRIWPVFLFAGILLCVISLFISNIVFNAALGITAFCCFWSIKELFQQQKRVEKDWFPQKTEKR